jgi:hypothetical protein
MTFRVFRDVAPFSLGVERRLRGTYCLHEQGDCLHQGDIPEDSKLQV